MPYILHHSTAKTKLILCLFLWQSQINFMLFFSCPQYSSSLTYVGTTTVNIFGNSLTYPIVRTFCSVRLENLEEVTKLLGILEEGEDISIVFIPGEETGIGEYVDQLGESGNNT